jgi:hypothetical protein
MGVRVRMALPIAVAMLVVGCGGGGTSSGAGPGAGSAQTGTATTVDDTTPFACPDPQDDGPMTGADTLPMGATAALLCFHDNRFAWVPPHGRLRTGLDDLVRVVNAQPVHDPKADEGCGGVGAPAWRMVLRYDGGTRTIGGDNGGCWDLLVGSTQRTGAQVVWHTYLAALLRQRRAQGSPGARQPRPACPDHVRTDDAFSPLADAAHLTDAVLCRTADMRVRHRIRLSPTQLRTLRHDFATAATRRTHLDGAASCHTLPPRSSAAIVGVDGWGDPFTVLTQCDTYRLLQPAHSRYVFARMLPATARMLGRLLAP